MRKISLALILAALLFAPPARADFTAKDAALATITFKNPGVCTSVVCVPVFQLYDGTNVANLLTAGADGVSNTLTGLPVYSRNVVFNGTTWDRWLGDATNGGFVNVKTSVLPTGASTSANQTTINTSIGTTNTALGAPGDTVCGTATGSCSLIALQKYNNNTNPVLGAGSATIGTVNQSSQYPAGAAPITASATGTTAATTATLAASASIKTYICGFSIRANATAAATANSTVTGTVTGTLNYTQWTAPLASGLGITEQIFSPCIPSSAINTGIAVISAAPGAGGVVSVSAWGYQL